MSEPTAFQYLIEGPFRIIRLKIRLWLEDIGSLIAGLIEDIMW
jgi:hypothetical protein